jgi:hypothetical protein
MLAAPGAPPKPGGPVAPVRPVVPAPTQTAPSAPQNRATPPVWLATWLPIVLAFIVMQREQKKRRHEEENQTSYSEDDLMNHWEFKILRDPLNRFGRPEFRGRILQEEAAGGWQLVEVFDAGRMRLKRPGDRRDASDPLPAGYDPYRLAVRVPPGYTWNVVLGIIFAIAAGMLGIFTLIHALDDFAKPGMWPLFLMGTVVTAALMVVCFVLARRTARQ